MKNQEILTVRKVYSQLVIFFFSTFFLILTFILQKNDSSITINYFAQGFFVLFFIGYSYLLGKMLEYYLVETLNLFKKNYPKYKLWYWLAVGVLALAGLFILGFYVLERQSFWNITISTLLVAILGLIGWVLKKIYEKYFKKD